MALPKLVTPEYTLLLPSTQEEIKFRAFLVKEQKVLMISQESGDERMIADALGSLVYTCTYGSVDAGKNPMFDIEYVFLQIRGKSVGSVVELTVVCPDDGETVVQTKVSLEDVGVQTNITHKTEFNLTDDIKINFKYPKLNDIKGLPEHATEFERMTTLVHHCIESVETPDEVINHVDMTAAEIEEFIDSFNAEQLEGVLEFFDTMPKVRHLLEVTNPVTGVKGEVLLEGIESFLE